MKDYSKLSNEELEQITNPNINKGGIPFAAVNERQKRFPNKYINRTINSHDFDSKGNFIGK